MKRDIKTSVSLDEDTVRILDAFRGRLVLSRSDLIRHLILAMAIHGPRIQTSLRIMEMPDRDRDRVLVEMRERAENPMPDEDGRKVPSGSLLSKDEWRAIDGLVDAWNAFLKLPPLHPDEIPEFRRIIHAGQQLVMARPVQREFNEAGGER